MHKEIWMTYPYMYVHTTFLIDLVSFHSSLFISCFFRMEQVCYSTRHKLSHLSTLVTSSIQLGFIYSCHYFYHLIIFLMIEAAKNWEVIHFFLRPPYTDDPVPSYVQILWFNRFTLCNFVWSWENSYWCDSQRLISAFFKTHF